MASTPVRALLPSGLGTLTLTLYPEGTAVAAHTSAVAEDTVSRRWTWTVIEALTGVHEAVITNASAAVVGGGLVDLADTTELHRIDAAASQASVDAIPAVSRTTRHRNITTGETADVILEEVP